MQLLLAKHVGISSTVLECPMSLVKARFDRLVQGRTLQQLAQDLRGALSMTVMAVTILQPPQGLAQQVFQWAQERSLMSSLELHNPKPGISLAVSDLVRNLVLAPLLDRPAQEMEQVLREHWLPLEFRFDNPRHFDAFLARFIAEPPQATMSPAAAPFLSTADGIQAMLPDSTIPGDLRLYAGFLSEYDALPTGSSDPISVIAMLSDKLQRCADGGHKEAIARENLGCNKRKQPMQGMPPPKSPVRNGTV